MRRAVRTIPLLVGALVLGACGGGESADGEGDDSPAIQVPEDQGGTTSTDPGAATQRQKPVITVPGEAPPSELKVTDLEEGTGATAKTGDQLLVHYVGVSYSTGKEFDASWDRGDPFPFQLGGRVIDGWNQGLEGMKVGGRRQLVIPPDLGYGERGSPPDIAPNETLIFVVDLLEIG